MAYGALFPPCSTASGEASQSLMAARITTGGVGNVAVRRHRARHVPALSKHALTRLPMRGQPPECLVARQRSLPTNAEFAAHAPVAQALPRGVESARAQIVGCLSPPACPSSSPSLSTIWGSRRLALALHPPQCAVIGAAGVRDRTSPQRSAVRAVVEGRRVCALGVVQDRGWGECSLRRASRSWSWRVAPRRLGSARNCASAARTLPSLKPRWRRAEKSSHRG
jgi:hypothetical protein